MKSAVLFVLCGIIFGIATSRLGADQLEMQNGDRYTGKVLSMSADTVVLQNEVLGKINLPRKKVASLTLGTNAVTPRVTGEVAASSVPTNLPSAAMLTALTRGNTNASADANVARQIREQMLAGSPEAAGKFDELVKGFMSGKLSLNDLRHEAKSSADQLRTLKRELGPEVGDSLDGYLEILDGFLNETTGGPTNLPPVPPPKTPGR